MFAQTYAQMRSVAKNKNLLPPPAHLVSIPSAYFLKGGQQNLESQ